MKKTVVFPALLAICSIISAFVYRSPFTYFNLFLSAVLLWIGLFSRDEAGQRRVKYSALWLLILELAAFALLLFGIDYYQSRYVWLMYAVFVLTEVYVTPRIEKKR